MADGFIGTTDLRIRSSGAVERMGNATDREPQERRSRQERREKDPPNPKRRRLYDLLFDEIDQIDALDGDQKARIKDNIRSNLTGQPPPPTPTRLKPDEDEEGVAAAVLANPDTTIPVTEDHIVGMAAPDHPQVSPEEAKVNAILAKQLRECLAHRTETERRVAVYLHLLLTIDGALRPHTVIEA